MAKENIEKKSEESEAWRNEIINNEALMASMMAKNGVSKEGGVMKMANGS